MTYNALILTGIPIKSSMEGCGFQMGQPSDKSLTCFEHSVFHKMESNKMHSKD